MNWVFTLLTSVLISTASHSQLVITATTDTTVYGFEQPIDISITVHNTGDQPVTLQWFTACQSEYWIDQYYSETGIFCVQVLTSLTLVPDSSHTWTRVHQPTHYLVTPGYHTIIGGVINYGQAQQKLRFFIFITANGCLVLSQRLIRLWRKILPFRPHNSSAFVLSFLYKSHPI